MNLKELMGKIDKLNNMNKKLDFDTKYYLVVKNRFMRTIYIYSRKDLKRLTEYCFTRDIADELINNELTKEERYLYTININNEKYDIRIRVE